MGSVGRGRILVLLLWEIGGRGGGTVQSHLSSRPGRGMLAVCFKKVLLRINQNATRVGMFLGQG